MAMQQHETTPPGRTGWHPALWAAAGTLLLVPAAAMRVPGSGVHWTASDFVVMGALLALACGTWEAAARVPGNALVRAGHAVAVLGGLLLVWANLAVGLVGDGGNPANLAFMGVVAVALLAAWVARGRAGAMARAMLVTAAVHAAVGVAAALGDWGPPHDGPLRIAATTAFFMLPWLLSAALFHRGARVAAY